MKLLSILLLVGGLQLSASVNAQNKLNIHLKNISVKQALDEVKKQSQFDLFYSLDEIDMNRMISIKLENAELLDGLRQILGDKYSFRETGNMVIIRPQDKNNADDKKVANIKGVVKDQSGVPLPGVSVVVKGTNVGVTTDIEGKFSIELPGKEMSLVFSFIGMKTQEVKIVKQTTLDIVLVEDKQELEEVVVTGMFTKSKESYTGAVTTVTEKEIKMFGNRNLLKTLKNIDPAFNIMESNEFGSDPNRLPDIKLRGASSLSNLTALKTETQSNLNLPVVILDGFEISLERMIDLNSEEVKSITILKDASATAIYGSRGANGVVVITSKEPEKGKLKVYYKSDINIEVPDLSGYDLLNAREKLDLEYKGGFYESSIPSTSLELQEQYAKNLSFVEKGIDTDWMSKPLRTGVGQRHNLRLEGGDDCFRYSTSVNYNHIAGVMKGSERKTFNGGIYLTYYHKNVVFRNHLNIGLNEAENSPYGKFSDYVKLNPYWAPYDENGKLVRVFDKYEYIWGGGYPANPLYNATLNSKNSSDYIDITNNLSIEWEIFKGLRLRSKVGVSKKIENSDKYFSPLHTKFEKYKAEDIGRKGTYDYRTGKSLDYDCNINLTYSKVFASKHNLYIGLDYRQSENSLQYYEFAGEGFVDDDLDFLSMALQYKKDSKPLGSESHTRSVGLTGNLNYIFDSRYFIDLSYRLDGSSDFGENKRFAPFWSAGIGWNIHREKFFNSESVINKLKLRGSYGTSGSQQFSAYQTASAYEFLIGESYLNWMGTKLVSLGNKDLEWQTTKQYNLGLETRFFNNLLTFNTEVYYKTTINLLSYLELPLANGFPSYPENIGEVDNTGFELMSSLFLLRNTEKRLFWSVTARMAYNKNNIKKISEAMKKVSEANLRKKGSLPQKAFVEGNPENAIYAVPSLGIDPSTGVELFLKKNGEVTSKWNAEDHVMAGIEGPKYLGNINSLVNLGNLSMSLSFGYHWGGQQYNQTLIDRVENADIKYNVDRRVYEDRWMKPGDKTFFKGVRDNEETKASTRFIQDESVFTCQNINISYDLRSKWIRTNMGMQTFSFSCNLSDVFYLSTIKRERGLHYPFSRKLSFSISATF